MLTGMIPAADLPKSLQALLDRGYSAEDIRKSSGEFAARVRPK